MFHRALWYQNYKQTKLIIFIILALYIIKLPFQAFTRIEFWNEQKDHAEQFSDVGFEILPFELYNVFSSGLMTFLLSFAVIFLAGLLIGIERNSRRHDFTFSLPFKRRDLFLAKTIYGALFITLFHTINFWIAYAIIRQSEFGYALDQVTLIEIFFGPLLAMLLIFTFAMFIGTIAGEMFSQVALTFIFAIFPIAFWGLLLQLISINFNTYMNVPDIFEYLTAFSYFTLFTSPESNDIQLMMYILIGIAISIIFGVLLYERNRVEHNGEFLIFKRLHPVFLVGMTICFSLLGGIIISSLVPWHAETLRVVSYWIGFFIFMFFAYLISKRLLKMNLMVKNK
ncbi:ABC transporter permease subunit [Evansella halocellulosilytica]|uniref:ABC transporter permease subunit n=1 Tax=Evansella halocellulosilytica TaxID=2011013 RepID=UPI0015C916CB|nr:ABC transporter permease subunit [Evansella halocellulosilytica]